MMRVFVRALLGALCIVSGASLVDARTFDSAVSRDVSHGWTIDEPAACLTIERNIYPCYYEIRVEYVHSVRVGDLGRAIGRISQLIALDQFSWFASNAYNERGIIYSRLGDEERAVADYTRALALAPRSYHILCNRAWSFIELGRFSMAQRDVSEAMKMNPSHSFVWMLRARLRERSGKWMEALSDYYRAESISRADWLARFAIMRYRVR